MSVANWDLAALQNRSQSLFAKIAAKFLGAKPAPPAVTGAMNVSARATFLAGSAMHAVPEFMRLSGNGTASVAVQLVRDLGHQPLCDDASWAGVGDVCSLQRTHYSSLEFSNGPPRPPTLKHMH